MFTREYFHSRGLVDSSQSFKFLYSKFAQGSILIQCFVSTILLLLVTCTMLCFSYFAIASKMHIASKPNS